MKRPRLIAALVICACFLGGAVVGAALTRVRDVKEFLALVDAPAVEARQRTFVWALDLALDLAPEQKRQLRALLETLAAETLPPPSPEQKTRIEAARRKFLEDFPKVLTPEQRAIYDRLLAKRARRTGQGAAGL